DRFKFINCKVSLKYPVNDNKNTVGFNWESPVAKNDISYDTLPEFTFQNCFVEYLNPVYIERLIDKTSNNGDVSTYAGGKARINIINLTNSLKNRATVIKSRTGKPSYSIQKTRVDSTFLPK
ncbi:MAG TPA: hypothetical protein VGN64_13390, partial [Dyadobacter sp.]|nr:hypothetical protein [Dyadobacter sp.]